MKDGGLALLVIAMTIAGCTSPPSNDTPSEPPTLVDGIVVAILDSGVNPYHVSLAGVGLPLRSIPGATLVTLAKEGNFSERVSEDDPFWTSVVEHQLYVFQDTRVMGITFGPTPGQPRLLDDRGHGTKVASLVAATSPSAQIVVVQINALVCELDDPAENCPIYVDFADAMEWVANESWIDIVQLSQNVPGNPPPPPDSPHVERFLAAQQRMHDRGGIIVNSAGNAVTPAVASNYGGPPWVISVGGFNNATRGGQPDAAKAVDLAGNYTARVPAPMTTDEWEYSSGTSFATPVVAGVLAEAAARLNVTPSPEMRERLRTALNHSAREVGPTDYDPSGYDPSGFVRDPRNNTKLPGVPLLAAGAETGWGLVDAGIIDVVVKAFLEGSQPRNAAQAATMAEYQAARERYWSQRDAGSAQRPMAEASSGIAPLLTP